MNEDWFSWHIKPTLINEIPENFYQLRKEGENENYISQLIRNDSIEYFIIYINKNNFSLHSTIPKSIYETNTFIIRKMHHYNEEEKENNLSLIEYATFSGSIQIFKYLQLNGVELTPQLWGFTIYSKNAELIHLLEENLIKPVNSTEKNEDENQYKECIIESIKCHHNDIVNYLLDNYFQIDYINSNEYFDQCLKFYNFSLIQNESKNENTFCYICKYDYYSLINLLSNIKNFNINSNI